MKIFRPIIFPIVMFSIAILFAVPAFAQNAVHVSLNDQSLLASPLQQTGYSQEDQADEQNHEWFLTDPDNGAITDKENEILKTDQPQENSTESGGVPDSVGVQDSGPTTEIGNTAKSTAQSDGYRLPRLANVDDPIGFIPLGRLAQADPSNLLTPLLPSQPNQPYLISVDQVSYANLSGTQPRSLCTCWQPTNFYHRPLLFEDANLERYGNHFRFQNLASTARFLGTIPILPYKIGSRGLNHRVYNLQYERPGDCVPSTVDDFTFDRRGGFWQALATAAIVIP